MGEQQKISSTPRPAGAGTARELPKAHFTPFYLFISYHRTCSPDVLFTNRSQKLSVCLCSRRARTRVPLVSGPCAWPHATGQLHPHPRSPNLQQEHLDNCIFQKHSRQLGFAKRLVSAPEALRTSLIVTHLGNRILDMGRCLVRLKSDLGLN